MDTVTGDGAHTQHLDRELTLIIPFLFVGQLWQLHIAKKLLERYYDFPGIQKEWQVKEIGIHRYFIKLL